MKFTVEDLKKQYDKAQSQKSARAKEIQEAEKKLAELKADAEKAAAEGELVAHLAIKDAIKEQEARLYVLVKSAASLEKVTPEQAREAWIDYAGRFSKDMAKRWADYEKDRAALCRKYEGMVEYQNEALKARRRVAEMSDTKEKDYILEGALPNEWQPDFPNNVQNVRAPEYAFFGLSGNWKYPHGFGVDFPALSTLNDVVGLQTPIDKVKF